MDSPAEIEIVPAGDLTYLCGLTVSIQFEKNEAKYSCKCRGVSYSKFIILTQPSVIKQKDWLLSTHQIILRYIYNGTVWGFKTNIVETIATPFRLIFIAYPEQIERHILRTCERAEVLLQANFSIFDKDLNVVIKDISCNGCRMIVNSPSREELFFEAVDQENDQVGILSFSADIFKEMITIECKIVRIRSDKNKTELGILFDLSDQETIDKITQYANHVLSLLA